MNPTAPQGVGVIRSFLAGVGFLGRGFGLWIRSPKLMLLGAIPALVVAVMYVVALVWFFTHIGDITMAVTGFADAWAEPWRTGTRIAAGLALASLVVLAAVATYAAVTLAVGDPFYERIWKEVEASLGGVPTPPDEKWWSSTARGIGVALRLVLVTALIAITLFALGFVPVVGQVIVPVLAALFGGWFLTLELSGRVFENRGLSLRDRRRILGARRARTLGFGVATYVLFLVPLVAVALMPAAVAGATMLGRAAVEETAGVPSRG